MQLSYKQKLTTVLTLFNTAASRLGYDDDSVKEIADMMVKLLEWWGVYHHIHKDIPDLKAQDDTLEKIGEAIKQLTVDLDR